MLLHSRDHVTWGFACGSSVGLIGGGQVPIPVEVSLARHSMLFLDELPAFRRHVLEGLRQPLKESFTRISEGTQPV